MALIFAFMMVASLIFLMWSSPGDILTTALGAAGGGVTLAISLLGIFIFWMGLLEIAKDSGLIAKLARILRPLNRWLFGKQDEEVEGLIATNISANMIGAGNAATPPAIEAIEKMAEPEQTKASASMVMLFVLAATSMQLLPTTIIGILSSHGSVDPSFVILPTFIVSTVTTLIGVLLVKLVYMKKRKRKARPDRTSEEGGTPV
ncbi:MAG: spore maturation protein [Firmicutes bacterium]|nr:spore maturation protein [Bacillota bacterium]